MTEESQAHVIQPAEIPVLRSAGAHEETNVPTSEVADKESHEGDNIREGQPNGPTSPAETGAQQPVDSVTEGLNAQPAAVVLSEFDREFQRAKDNPSDFNQWVAVEKLLDKENDIEKTRQVYDAFLGEYPLCYAYWKKYAEREHKSSTPEWAISVYKRGTAAVPYSCDLWGHFATYMQRIASPAEEVREVFENGAAYVGTDYLSHILWDKYIKFEVEQGSPAHVTRLYLQVLGSPLRDLDKYYTRFKEYINNRSLSELVSEEEVLKTTDLLTQARLLEIDAQQEHEAEAAAETQQKAEGETKPEASTALKTESEAGNEAVAMEIDETSTVIAQQENDLQSSGVKSEKAQINGNAAAEEQILGNIVKAEPEQLVKAEPELKEETAIGGAEITNEDIKAYWLSGIDALHRESKEELARRKPFEDLIKRPYFHIKPLPAVQLEAWDSYLDYILEKHDAGNTVRLFERCLVACAGYPDFWMRYVRYLAKQDPSNAPMAIQRAQQVHCKREASIHLFAAKYQELAGDIESARSTYKLLLSVLAPDLVEAIVQAANFERRQSNSLAACKLFDDALEREEAKMEEGKADSGAMLVMFYAKFLFLDCHEPVKTRQLYQRALQKWRNLRYLWEAALHFEEHCLEEGRTERILGLYEEALSNKAEKNDTSKLSLDDRQILSQQLVDFADGHCSPSEALAFEERHALTFSTYKVEAANKKRSADSSRDEPAAKKAAPNGVSESAGQKVLPQPNQAAYIPASIAASAGQPAAAPVISGAAPVAAGVAPYSYADPAAAYVSQPMVSGASQATYYPQASAGYSAYGYGYQYPQQYGYNYAGYQ